jgi:hypothetical protein
MEWIAYILGGFVALGAGLALFEARRKRNLISDERLPTQPQTEIDRDIQRAGNDFNPSSTR